MGRQGCDGRFCVGPLVHNGPKGQNANQLALFTARTLNHTKTLGRHYSQHKATLRPSRGLADIPRPRTLLRCLDWSILKLIVMNFNLLLIYTDLKLLDPHGLTVKRTSLKGIVCLFSSYIYNMINNR
jgi:hypothetical protein